MHIDLKTKEYKTTDYSLPKEQISKMKQATEEAAKLQEELGLGKPNSTLLTSHLELAENRKLLNEIIKSTGYKIVDVSDRKQLPFFSSRKENTMWENSGVKFEKPPAIAVVKLERHVDKISCQGTAPMGDKREFHASLPIIPVEGSRRAKQISDLSNGKAEFYLAFMPSWEESYQKDPILMAKIADEFISIYEWGGDLEMLQEFILEK